MSAEETAIAEAQNTSLSATSACGLTFEAEDIDIPRLNLVQKMSEIDAPNGAIVLDKTFVLAEEGTPLEVIVVSAQKGWRENIPFDEDETPRIAWTREHADTIASSSEWGLVEFAEITLLIKQPEGCTNDEAFAFPIGDSNYAMGRINVSKNAYRSTYKRLATFAAFNRNTALNSRVWSLVSEVLTKGKYTWHNPSLAVTKTETDPAVIEFLNNFGA